MTYVEHPVEVARRALLQASEFEEDLDWVGIMRRIASALPSREPVQCSEVWARVPYAERVHLIFNALGDDRVGIGELTARVDAALVAQIGPTGVYPSGIQRVLYKLLQSGEIERTKKMDRRGRTRWVYFRRTSLSPELEALQQAWDSTEGPA